MPTWDLLYCLLRETITEVAVHLYPIYFQPWIKRNK